MMWISARRRAREALHRQLHQLEGRAAHECRREVDPHGSVVTSTPLITPRSTIEITGISGSGILARSGPDGVGGHHRAPAGAERRTIVISSHSSASSASCTPRDTGSTSGSCASDRSLARLRSSGRSSSSSTPRRTARARRRLRSGGLSPSRTTAGARPTSPRAWGVPPRDPSSRRFPRCPDRWTPSAPRAGSRPPSRTASGARSPAPIEPPELDERRTIFVRLPVEAVSSSAVVPSSAAASSYSAPRVTDLVLCDRRERDVLLEEGRYPVPLRVPPAEEELVVGDAQQEICALAHSASPPGAIERPAFSRASRSRALIVAVDAPVLHLEFVGNSEIWLSASRGTSQTGTPAVARTARARRSRRSSRRARHGARVLEGLSLPLLPEDLEDHAGTAWLPVRARGGRRPQTRSLRPTA